VLRACVAPRWALNSTSPRPAVSVRSLTSAPPTVWLLIVVSSVNTMSPAVVAPVVIARSLLSVTAPLSRTLSPVVVSVSRLAVPGPPLNTMPPVITLALPIFTAPSVLTVVTGPWSPPAPSATSFAPKNTPASARVTVKVLRACVAPRWALNSTSPRPAVSVRSLTSAPPTVWLLIVVSSVNTMSPAVVAPVVIARSLLSVTAPLSRTLSPVVVSVSRLAVPGPPLNTMPPVITLALPIFTAPSVLTVVTGPWSPPAPSATSFAPKNTPASARVTVKVLRACVAPRLALNSTLPRPAVSVRSLTSAPPTVWLLIVVSSVNTMSPAVAAPVVIARSLLSVTAPLSRTLSPVVVSVSRLAVPGPPLNTMPPVITLALPIFTAPSVLTVVTGPWSPPAPSATSFAPKNTPASARVTVKVLRACVAPRLALNSTLPRPAVSVRSLTSAPPTVWLLIVVSSVNTMSPAVAAPVVIARSLLSVTAPLSRTLSPVVVSVSRLAVPGPPLNTMPPVITLALPIFTAPSVLTVVTGPWSPPAPSATSFAPKNTPPSARVTVKVLRACVAPRLALNSTLPRPAVSVRSLTSAPPTVWLLIVVSSVNTMSPAVAAPVVIARSLLSVTAPLSRTLSPVVVSVSRLAVPGPPLNTMPPVITLALPIFTAPSVLTVVTGPWSPPAPSATSFAPKNTPASARVTVKVLRACVAPRLALNSTLPRPAVSVRSLTSAPPTVWLLIVVSSVNTISPAVAAPVVIARSLLSVTAPLSRTLSPVVVSVSRLAVPGPPLNTMPPVITLALPIFTAPSVLTVVTGPWSPPAPSATSFAPKNTPPSARVTVKVLRACVAPRLALNSTLPRPAVSVRSLTSAPPTVWLLIVVSSVNTMSPAVAAPVVIARSLLSVTAPLSRTLSPVVVSVSRLAVPGPPLNTMPPVITLALPIFTAPSVLTVVTGPWSPPAPSATSFAP